MRAWLLELLAALRRPGDRFPVGDMRDLMAEVLGLVGAASMLLLVVGVTMVPATSNAGLAIAIFASLLPLLLRWVVQRAPIHLTVPAILLSTVMLGVLWIRAVGSLQAVQSALLLLPLIFATFIYGPRVGLLSAAGVSLLVFALAAGLTDANRRGSLSPVNQAWILSEFAFITVLCVIGLHRYVARTHRQAVDARAKLQADQNLLGISHRLRMAVDAGQFGVWEFDVQAGSFSIDAQQARLYGISTEIRAVSFDQWRASVQRSDRDRAAEQFMSVVELDKPYDLTFRIRRADGAMRWLRSLGQPVRDEQGKVVRVVGLDRDVTEQEEGSQALREAGERLTMAVSAAGGVAWTVDGAYRRLQWNAPGLEVYGVDLLEHPDAWLDVVLPDDLVRVAAAWREALTDGAPEEFEFEFRIRHGQRGVRHIRCVGRCEHDHRGTLLRAVGIDIDISSQREAAARVSELSERLALAASASGMGTWQLDLKVGSIAWDERQSALYGLPEQACQVGSTQWAQWLEPEDRPALRAVLDGSVERMEWSLQPVGGQALGRRVRTMAQTLRSPQGEALRRVGASFDITAEWQAQQAIERARAEAEQSSRAKSAFLANMSHEIRTPMNAVIGLTGLLLDTVGPGQAHQHASKAHAAARGLLAVLNDVLDVSKIEAGKLDLERRRFALAEVFGMVSDTLAHEAQSKGLVLRMVLDADAAQPLAGRPGAAPADPAQPGQQRCQVHPAWHRVPACARRRSGWPALRGRRHRHRHGPCHSGPHLRCLRAGGCLHHPPLRWHWPGADHLPPPRAPDGR